MPVHHAIYAHTAAKADRPCWKSCCRVRLRGALGVNVRKTALKHPCKGIPQYVTPKGKPHRSCSGALCQACLPNPHPASAACMCPTQLLPCILAW